VEERVHPDEEHRRDEAKADSQPRIRMDDRRDLKAADIPDRKLEA
jgi:hypothetical protein